MTTTKKKTTKKAAAKKAVAKKAAKTTAKTTAVAAPETATPKQTSKGTIIALIQREGGATLAEIMTAINWQAHSVRGTIATLGKTMKIESTKNANGERTYSAA